MPTSTSHVFYNTIAAALSLDVQIPVVIMSPHIDDAVWSLGPVLKALAENGHELRLVNLFSMTAIVGDHITSPRSDTAVRKAEEAVVSGEVGFRDVMYLDFPDGILRDRDPQTIFDVDYRTPVWLAERLLTVFGEQVPDQALVFAPSGFGWHIDHQLAARIALRLSTKLIFYEDLPYAARTVRIKEARQFLQHQAPQEIRLPASAAIIAEHLRLYRLYASQRSQHHEEQISTYLSAHGYGLWRKRAESVIPEILYN